MRANLIVIKEGEIAFSRYYGRPNGMPTIVSWDDLITGKGFMNIPVGRHGFFLLKSTELHENRDKALVIGGAIAITIFAGGGADELYSGDDPAPVTIPMRKGSFYARSGGWDLESAATAANFVYDNVVDIYRASQKAVDHTLFPFYTGKTKDIGKALQYIKELDERGRELLNKAPEDFKDTSKYFRRQINSHLKLWNDTIDHFDECAKLTLHNR